MATTQGMSLNTDQAKAVTGSVTVTPAEDEQALKWFQAARAKAWETFPYLSSVLSAMIPVSTPGLGTVACDARWRIYYDPQRILGIGERFSTPQTLDEIVSDWLHEAGHLLYGHAERWADLREPSARHPIYNAAGDARINANNAEMDVVVLPSDVTYQSLAQQGYSVDPQWTTEQTYRHLLEKISENTPPCPQHGPSGKPTATSDSSDTSQGSGNDSGNDDDDTGNGLTSDGSGAPDDASAGNEASGACTCTPGTATPDFGKDCGSGSGGEQRPWEMDINDGQNDGSIEPGRGELIRDLAAKEIAQSAKQAGTVPGDLARWANARLSPAVDWRRELRSVVSRHLGMQAGKTDYSYARLPRRRIPGVITPGMVQSRPPSVAVVIDTSGSMSMAEIDQAVADLAGLLRAVTGSAVPVRVLPCDAAVGEVQHLTSVKNLELTGGGGTHMGVGIHAAATLRPTPDVIVTLTDGYTGWPSTPDPAAPSALYVAVILNSDQADEVPSFMHAITVIDGQREH